MKSIRKPVFALVAVFFAFGPAACKKSSSSPNHVRFTLNGGTPMVATTDIRPGYDFLGGGNCEFEFDRLGGDSTTGGYEIGVFVENDCNLLNGTLPYPTTHFTLGILTYPNNGSA